MSSDHKFEWYLDGEIKGVFSYCGTDSAAFRAKFAKTLNARKSVFITEAVYRMPADVLLGEHDFANVAEFRQYADAQNNK